MKKITNFLIILLATMLNSASSFAQVPQKMSYQAVIRDASNALLVTQSVGMQISILQSTPTGTLVYSETQTPTTNTNGLVSLEIGTGTVVSGNFTTINWVNGPYFIKTETDPSGGSVYTISGTSELMSVPYALYAKTAENITGTVVETDPVFGVSPANVITTANITNWSAAYTWGDHTGLYRPISYVPDWSEITNKPTGGNPGDMLYWNGSAWVVVPVGTNGQQLFLNSSNIPVWQNAPSTNLLAPTVVIQAADNLLSSSARLNGNVNANNLISTVIFEYGLTTSYGNQTTAIQSPVAGTSVVTISADILGLQPATTYHFRIKATNAVDVANSNDMSFTTDISIPQLTTTAISSILTNSANSGGDITNDGGSPVTARGVCYNTSPNPTIANSIVAGGTGTGSFISNITGLASVTTYYVRAYATNTAGTSYGNELSFITGTPNYSLTASTAGNGSGNISSSPAGINCPATCSQSFSSGTPVTLTATAAFGSTFTGWSGACAGTGTCFVTMNSAINVTANFTLNTYNLTVTKAGAGSGTVTSTPAGINCGGTCSSFYNFGTTITLTAAPSSGTFVGWSGGCTGTGTCIVSITAATSVTANFAP